MFNFLKRNKYEFTHSQIKTPILIRAKTEDAAWIKFEKRLIRIASAPTFGLIYDSEAVAKVMRRSKCKLIVPNN